MSITTCWLNAQDSILETDFNFKGKLYKLKAEKNKEGSFKFFIKDNGDSSEETFTLQPLKLNSFENGFNTAFTNLLKPNATESEKLTLRQEFKGQNLAEKLFIELIAASFEIDETAPIAGRIYIEDSVRLYSYPRFQAKKKRDKGNKNEGRSDEEKLAEEKPDEVKTDEVKTGEVKDR